ncbi:MAG: RNA polymerase sigma factor [Armatimonadetes bacterium]|nr:RNA polymerase sigma factor [Armatimonadota bacterium]
MEEQVIRGCGSKADTDSQAVRAIELYRDRVYRLALAIVSDPELAEDVAQDTLARAFRDRRQLRDRSAVEAWLRRITVRQALNACRTRRSTRVDIEPPDETDNALNLAVREALAQLKPKHSAVLALAMYEGLTHREISDALDIPEGTVASRIHAAKAAFKQIWEDEQ